MKIEDLKGCFANVNDDELLRENGLLYAENKELKEEIERLENIIKEVRELLSKYNDNESNYYAPIDMALYLLDKENKE